MGRDAQQQVKKTVPVLADPEVTAYVARLGKTLAARAKGPRYPYSFSVANYRELNAFALPGGPVWIHRGILHAAANESQVAGVLAHEIAHIAAAARRRSDHQAAGRQWISRSARRRARQRSRRRAHRADRREHPRRRLPAQVQPRRRARRRSRRARDRQARRLGSSRHGRFHGRPAARAGPRSRVRRSLSLDASRTRRARRRPAPARDSTRRTRDSAASAR